MRFYLFTLRPGEEAELSDFVVVLDGDFRRFFDGQAKGGRAEIEQGKYDKANFFHPDLLEENYLEVLSPFFSPCR